MGCDSASTILNRIQGKVVLPLIISLTAASRAPQNWKAAYSPTYFLIYWYPPQNWPLNAELSFSSQYETRMLRRKGNRNSYHPPSACCRIFTLSTYAFCDGNCWRQGAWLDGTEVWSNLSICRSLSVSKASKLLLLNLMLPQSPSVLYFPASLSNGL